MKFFITGGTGFIGRPLIKRLAAEGHTLAILSRRPTSDLPAKVIQGDLEKIEGWEKEFISFAPDIVFHLAWEGLPDYSLATCLKNLQQGCRLYNLVLAHGCTKIVTAGTCWEYGEKTGKVTTKDEGNVLNLFASTKKSLRLIGESLLLGKEIDFIWARIFFVYGENQRATSLIPSFVQSIRQNQDPKIRNLQAVNDFIYVEDVAEALASLVTLKGKNSRIVNIGMGTPYSVEEIQNMVMSLIKNDSKGFIPRQNHSVANGFWCDSGELTHLTGWKPRHDLASGMRITLQRMGVLL